MSSFAAVRPLRDSVPTPGLVEGLLDYYAPDATHCGASFLDGTEIEHQHTVVPGDLFAVTLLGFPVPPAAARRLLHQTPESDRVLACLAALPLDTPLAEADADVFAAMLELQTAVLAALEPAPGEQLVTGVAASALCARKRPELFPVLEPQLCEVLGLPGAAHPLPSWQGLRRLLADGAIEEAAAELYRAAHAAAPRLRLDVYPLRRLQVLISLGWSPAGW